MRGKVISNNSPENSFGITPAYAGKSPLSDHIQNKAWDHPRLCGEKLTLDSPLLNSTGSPPPMRGKVYVQSCNGLTLEDHPRLCGEKIFSLFSHAPQMGSPPPMRGKVRAVSKVSDSIGITPAYAGKSSFSTMFIKISEDHPRLCGEKFASSPFAYLSWGSPPPMRGKAKRKGENCKNDRITPAYAGKRRAFFHFVFPN